MRAVLDGRPGCLETRNKSRPRRFGFGLDQQHVSLAGISGGQQIHPLQILLQRRGDLEAFQGNPGVRSRRRGCVRAGFEIASHIDDGIPHDHTLDPRVGQPMVPSEIGTHAQPHTADSSTFATVHELRRGRCDIRQPAFDSSLGQLPWRVSASEVVESESGKARARQQLGESPNGTVRKDVLLRQGLAQNNSEVSTPRGLWPVKVTKELPIPGIEERRSGRQRPSQAAPLPLRTAPTVRMRIFKSRARDQ